MKADFIVNSGETVPSNYSWDNGEPLDGSNNITAYTTQTYASGYAPGVKVSLLNTSVEQVNYPHVNYTWNFGDYYNDVTSEASLSCISLVEHTYIMPGKYTVTLNITQTQQQEDKVPELINPNDYICRGKGGVRWFWDNLNENSPALTSICITWDESDCNSADVQSGTDYDKWWADELKCFQKYCKLWSWEAMKNNFVFRSPKVNPEEPVTDNPVRWEDTKDGKRFRKKWMYEANNIECIIDDIEVVEALTDTVSRFTVEVIEIPPVAGMTCITRPVTGYSPFTVRLSPTACKCGSFPIDRIDWDFGDGTPIRTVTRYFLKNIDSDLVLTNTFSADTFSQNAIDVGFDVRNLDVLHTYHVNKNTYPVFYPSLTCYSANTNTSDSCSTTVGPVLYPATSQDLQLIKAKNTIKGIVYGFNVDNNVTFTTTTQISSSGSAIAKPQNPLRDSIGNTAPAGRGYTGEGYPEFVEPVCNL